MTAHDIHSPAEGGLPPVVRHILGHDAEGKSVFLPTDCDGHHRKIVNNPVIDNNLNSTDQQIIDFDGEVNIKYACENKLNVSEESRSVCRMIDFTPGSVLPIDRVNHLDSAVVIEGVFKLILDSGEERIMQRGDVAAQLSTTHKWVNATGNGLLPARILFILLRANNLHTISRKVQIKPDVPRRNTISLVSLEVTDRPHRSKGPDFYENDFFESEF
ncbi:hypothetical protein PFICI_04041 [Pestalotiopsis fici W106-1]|uniref:Uncharacterized protein n=1 Tax=Pestalotiopsis fici (strain W106-1 / CGMCC3.15140) TaxID=1229662 RepID=W3XL69_PESFW|nr:uncharacterized protein PFICI_04041 [Pestalotiopsis fici W106-1]ETS86016.1 hypothetical protein PFICI_04041 [Pestalotiopsis fici W106-1]